MATIVTTFAELHAALQDTDETHIQFGADIVMDVTGGIQIPNTKTSVVIDGADGSCGRYRYTDYGPDSGIGSAANTIRYQSSNAGQRTVTIQNMIISGRNYYGVLYNPGGVNTTYSFRNVLYIGPQPLHNDDGQAEIYDSDITVDKSIFSQSEEIAECNRGVLGGKTTIVHRPITTSYNIFGLAGATATRAVTIAAGADISITSTGYFFDRPNYGFLMEENARLVYTTENTALVSLDVTTPFELREGASFTLITDKGFANTTTDRFGPITIGKNASLRCVQTGRNGVISTLYCAGDFTVAEGASVYLEAAYENANELIDFYGTGRTLRLQNPKRFVLKSTTNSSSLINFSSTNRIELEARQANLWTTAPAPDDPGGFDNLPDSAWRRLRDAADDDPFNPDVIIKGAATNTAFTLDADGTNLSAAEQALLSNFSELIPAKAYVFAVGRLDLNVNPIAVDGYPIFGRTEPGAALKADFTVEGQPYHLTGTADAQGKYSLPTGVELPLDTRVTVAGSRQFLYGEEILGVVPVGEITLSEPPAQLPFLARVISTDPVKLCGREDTDWSLAVTDSRARSTPWRVTTASDNILRSAGGYLLPDGLVFVSAETDPDTALPVRRAHILSATPTVVWEGAANGGMTLVTGIRWGADLGLLLQVTGAPFQNGETYHADIRWALEVDPLE